MSKNQQNISESLEKPVKKQETQKGQQAETAVGPSFESLLKLTETPPHIKEILGQLDLRGLDFKSALEQIDNVIIGELIKNPEGEVAKDLRKYQAKIDELLNEMEKDSISVADAGNIFKEELVKAFGGVGYTWVVNKEMPNGYFVLRQKNAVKTLVVEPGDNPKIGDKDKSGKFVYEGKEEKTNKEFWTRIVSGSKESVTGEEVPLDTKEVRKIFNKLEPAVRTSLIGGWKDSLLENIKLTKKFRQKLRQEKRQEKREELKKQIKEHEEEQEEIRKKIKALA